MIASNQEVATDAPTIDAAGPEPPAREHLTKDQIFHLLQNERRRLALTYLQGVEGEVKMRDIAEQVAAWEHDTTVEALDSDQRQRVYIPLYQNHLPKLDEEGVIEYDQSRGVVRRTPVAAELEPYLFDDDASSPAPDGVGPADRDDRWPRYYLATSLFSTALIAGVALDIPLLAGVSAIAIGLLVVLAFSTLTVAHFLQTSAPIRREHA